MRSALLIEDGEGQVVLLLPALGVLLESRDVSDGPDDYLLQIMTIPAVGEHDLLISPETPIGSRARAVDRFSQ